MTISRSQHKTHLHSTLLNPPTPSLDGNAIRHSGTILAAIALLAASGCSSLTQSEMQTVALSATHEGKPVSADCKLVNDHGAWESKAPANVMIHKSSEDLNVTCKAPDMPDGLLKAISRAAGSMFGNIIFGGGIGALIDHNNGKGYDYPNTLPVRMGQTVIVDKKEEQKPELQAATPVCKTPGLGC